LGVYVTGGTIRNFRNLINIKIKIKIRN